MDELLNDPEYRSSLFSDPASYFMFAGMSVLIIFWFHREWLIAETSYQVVKGLSIILFLAGVIALILVATGPPTSEKQIPGTLLCPLLHLGIFRAGLKVFNRRFGRDPEDTWKKLDPNLKWDGIFNTAFFLLAMGSLVLFAELTKLL